MNKSRLIIVVLAVFIFFVALIVKLFNIQILRSEELKYFAERQQMGLEKIKAERGLIYDRNNVLLVYNRDDISFYLDLRMANEKTRKQIAKKFSSVFGKTAKEYLSLMDGSAKTICLEKKAPSEKALLLKNYKANGLFFKEDPSRVYQYQKLASHVLGFVDNDNNGVSGIEKSFQDKLKGADGSMLVEKDAIGDMMTVAEEQTIPAQPGQNLVLTIDKTYQAILEEELHTGVDSFHAVSATGIIMDPNNGEILALANVNDYDPNNYWDYDDDSRRDRAITDTYEPGSTFKSITMAALLDQHLCNENDQVFTENGRYKFNNVTITDSHELQWLTARGVIEQSSNIGMSKLAMRIDDEIFYKYLRGFGFGNYTSAELPGEVKGTLRKPNLWSAIDKAFISFGYGISVTPLQMISAYSALINGGTLYQPQIIKRTISGTVAHEYQPKLVRTVISKETSDRIRNILQGVVDNGTGKNAKLSFIPVGGKTGTSQKLVDGKYSSLEYNSSFIGFFPVQNPKVICLILMHSPQVGRYGGLAAAPVFKNVAQRIVQTYPDQFGNPVFEQKNENQHFASTDTQKDYAFTNVSETVTLKKPVYVNKSTMPDLTNSSVRDAMILLNKIGIRYKVNGSGRIISQSITPGSKISKRSVCNLTCAEITVSGTAVY